MALVLSAAKSVVSSAAILLVDKAMTWVELSAAACWLVSATTCILFKPLAILAVLMALI